METPLYNGKKVFHHNKSSFRSRGMQNEPLSDISLSQFNKREIKILIMLSEEFSSPDEILSVDACLLGCGG
jgi:hypothetical protein